MWHFPGPPYVRLEVRSLHSATLFSKSLLPREHLPLAGGLIREQFKATHLASHWPESHSQVWGCGFMIYFAFTGFRIKLPFELKLPWDFLINSLWFILWRAGSLFATNLSGLWQRMQIFCTFWDPYIYILGATLLYVHVSVVAFAPIITTERRNKQHILSFVQIQCDLMPAVADPGLKIISRSVVFMELGSFAACWTSAWIHLLLWYLSNIQDCPKLSFYSSLKWRFSSILYVLSIKSNKIIKKKQ